jgi:hypothetical protein
MPRRWQEQKTLLDNIAGTEQSHERDRCQEPESCSHDCADNAQKHFHNFVCSAMLDRDAINLP